MTRPERGTPEHRAWTLGCIVEAAHRAGRRVADMTRPVVDAMRSEADEDWPHSRDWEAVGGFARARAAAAFEIDGPSGDETPTRAELGERRSVQRDLLYARRLERMVGDAEHWTDRVSRAVLDGLARMPHVRAPARHAPPSYVGDREVVVLLSDTHYGQIIDPREVPGSRYGWREAARRTAFLVREAASYKPAHRDRTTCRLLLCGDLIEGELRGPSRDSYDLTTQICGALAILSGAITYLREHFSRVDVVCATGNHERWPHQAHRAITRKHDGIGHVMYYALSRIFERDQGVTWAIPKSPYTTWQTPGGVTCAITHGDTVINAGSPAKTVHVHKIAEELRKMNAARAQRGEDPIRALALGHYHVPLRVALDDGADVVVNGCLGGTAAYAQGGYGVHGSRPAQCIWESTARHPVGDLRVVEVARGDEDAGLDAVIPRVTEIGEAA